MRATTIKELWNKHADGGQIMDFEEFVAAIEDDREQRTLVSPSVTMPSGALCKGSIMLGSACGQCERCKEEISNMPNRLEAMRKQLRANWEHEVVVNISKARDEERAAAERTLEHAMKAQREEFETVVKICLSDVPGAAVNSCREDYPEVYALIEGYKQKQKETVPSHKDIYRGRIVFSGLGGKIVECAYCHNIYRSSAEDQKHAIPDKPGCIACHDDVGGTTITFLSERYTEAFVTHTHERCADCARKFCILGCTCECHRRHFNCKCHIPTEGTCVSGGHAAARPAAPSVAAVPDETRPAGAAGDAGEAAAGHGALPELGFLRYRTRFGSIYRWKIKSWLLRHANGFPVIGREPVELKLTLEDNAEINIEIRAVDSRGRE